MLVMVAAKACAGTADRREPWYGTHYSTRRLTPEELAAFDAAAPASLPPSLPPSPSSLHLPMPNDFIPSDFTLVTPAGEIAGSGTSTTTSSSSQSSSTNACCSLPWCPRAPRQPFVRKC
ncbi:hypothetical protein Naga_102750g1 [Nannochloropsis gaditana]|uniref:Peptidase M16 middle/third domain-containing protein n=1 Tax=Nannochloropsis gaditana TaxID=72520 RepID=W7T8Z7_9STRA|nr:hypothetical protein Naga_102750g1 [Nannochloropsis gaditana]